MVDVKFTKVEHEIEFVMTQKRNLIQSTPKRYIREIVQPFRGEIKIKLFSKKFTYHRFKTVEGKTWSFTVIKNYW